jgi:protein involved in polysaccharide export with SLBB domain
LERSAVKRIGSRQLLAALAVLASLAPALVLGSSAASAQPAYAANGRYDPWTDEDYRYRIGAGDELALHFVVNPDLNAAVIVGPDGRAVLPLVGPVKLTGMTVEEADQAMTAAYGAVLRNPQVQALVTAYGASQIYVGGEVKDPGVKVIKGQIGVTQAVLAAGGFTDTARGGQVVVLRQGPNDPRPRMRIVDVRGALQGKDRRGLMLMPGDVVFVPKSSIAELDIFMKQHLADLLPFSLSYGIGSNGRL